MAASTHRKPLFLFLKRKLFSEIVKLETFLYSFEFSSRNLFRKCCLLGGFLFTMVGGGAGTRMPISRVDEHTVGVKRMSPVDTELLFIILYNIIALHRNTNIFFLWKSSNLNK